LDPLRIAAVPGATLDVVVRGPLSPSNELSLEPLQRALPDTPPKGNNPSSTLVSNTATRAATTVKRNPVDGLVEEAMQNYNHIDNPATLPPRRGPQTILDERAASKENDTDIQNPPKQPSVGIATTATRAWVPPRNLLLHPLQSLRRQ
jgi:hypothetical protein